MTSRWPCRRRPRWPALVVVLTAAAVSRWCAVAGAEWVERPEDASAPLGGSATFNCSAGRRSGDVAWLKIDDAATGATTLLFVNTQAWNVDTRRVRAVAMTGGGVSLTVDPLERSDDAQYQCSIQNSSLVHTVRLTVLGIRPVLFCSSAVPDPTVGHTANVLCYPTSPN